MSGHCLHPMSPGTLLLIDAWEPHGDGYSIFDGHLLHMWGHFFLTGLEVELLEVAKSGERLFDQMQSFVIGKPIADIVLKRWDELSLCGMADEKTVQEYLREPMTMILDEVAYQLRRSGMQMAASSAAAAVCNYIRSHNGRQCGLKQLQTVANLSKYHLCRSFRMETGYTIGEFINIVRKQFVDSARQKGIRSKEIAAELGFSSVTCFYNWQQKHRDIPEPDVTPSEPRIM